MNPNIHHPRGAADLVHNPVTTDHKRHREVTMTRSIRGILHELHLTLQDQFDRQTDELVKLTGYRTDPDTNSLDPQTVDALTASTRQALADTTEALQRMNDGSYGVCRHCGDEIPIERLEVLPSARYCMDCQRVRRG